MERVAYVARGTSCNWWSMSSMGTGLALRTGKVSLISLGR